MHCSLQKRVRCSTESLRQESNPLPALWNIDVRTVQRRDGRATEQSESTFHISSQNLDRTLHPCFTRRSQTVRVSTPTQNRTRAQANGFDHVGSATNASVHKHLELTIHRLDNFRQRSQRGRNAIELAASVI